MLDYMKIHGRYKQKCPKNGQKKCVRLAICRGFDLWLPWSILAGILGHDSGMVRLYAIQISLGYDEVGFIGG